jgi:hypothetical protein
MLEDKEWLDDEDALFIRDAMDSNVIVFAHDDANPEHPGVMVVIDSIWISLRPEQLQAMKTKIDAILGKVQQ